MSAGRVPCLFLCLLLRYGTLYSVPLTEIKGEVVDEQGKAISDAEVALVLDTEVLKKTITAKDGTFVFPNVPQLNLPLAYHLRISSKGYRPQELRSSPGSSIKIRLTRVPTLNIRDFLGAMEEISGGVARILDTAGTEITAEYPTNPTWNRWIEDTDAASVVESLTVGRTYTIHLDLAGIEYRPLGVPNIAMAADSRITEMLSTGKLTHVLVKPFLENDAARFVFDEGHARLYRVSLDKLRRAHEIAESLKDATDMFSYSEALAAVAVPITIHADHAGCARLGFVLWDAELNHPLDVVRTSLSLGSDKSSSAACGVGASVQTLSTGVAETLLGSDASSKAVAGLFVFEFSGEAKNDIKNTALFVGPDSAVLSWSPPRKLVPYVFGDGQDTITSKLRMLRRSTVEDIGKVSREFTGLLFDDNTAGGKKQATQALESLRKSALAHAVTFRFTDYRGNTKPFPFGLIQISPTSRLGDIATVTEPLPSAHFTDDKDCFADWTEIIPSSLGKEVPAFFLQADPHPPTPLERDWASLEAYFAGAGSRAKGEGLVLLSHHENGVLFFDPAHKDESGQSLQASMIRRRYSRGSVAVLSSCATRSLTSSNESLPLISQLGQNGVDAIVSAPFEITAAVAARFAENFGFAVATARSTHTIKSFRELFETARDLTRSESLVSSWKGELAELIVMGADQLKMCK